MPETKPTDKVNNNWFPLLLNAISTDPSNRCGLLWPHVPHLKPAALPGATKEPQRMHQSVQLCCMHGCPTTQSSDCTWDATWVRLLLLMQRQIASQQPWGCVVQCHQYYAAGLMFPERVVASSCSYLCAGCVLFHGSFLRAAAVTYVLSVCLHGGNLTPTKFVLPCAWEGADALTNLPPNCYDCIRLDKAELLSRGIQYMPIQVADGNNHQLPADGSMAPTINYHRS
jgi:hypothetical protein